MSVDFQRTTLRYIPEEITLHNHRCENLKSYKSLDISSDSDQAGGRIFRGSESVAEWEDIVVKVIMCK
jgi:hypothetical protein